MKNFVVLLALILALAPVSMAQTSVQIKDGKSQTLGSKADAADPHTDTTAISEISILKEISLLLQTPVCTIPILYDANTNGKTQLIALSSGKTIYVCGLVVSTSSSSAVTVSLGSGTGTNCGTTYTAKTPAWPIQLPASQGPGGMQLNMSAIPWFTTNASEELCISTNAGVSVQVIGMAAQF